MKKLLTLTTLLTLLSTPSFADVVGDDGPSAGSDLQCNIDLTGYTTGGEGAKVRKDVETSLRAKGYKIVLNNHKYSVRYETFDSSPDLGHARIFSNLIVRDSDENTLIEHQIEGSGFVFFNKPKKGISKTTLDSLKLMPTCSELEELVNN